MHWHTDAALCMNVCNTGCSLTDLTTTDAVTQCADRGFANTLPIPNGMVCYSTTEAGSEAIYVCSDGFHQDSAATRVCQSDGVWNGSLPQCLPNLERQGTTVSVHYCSGKGFSLSYSYIKRVTRRWKTGSLSPPWTASTLTIELWPSGNHQPPQCTACYQLRHAWYPWVFLILTYFQLAVGNNVHAPYFTLISGAMESLSISTAVGIAVASTTVVIFIAGFLAGILVYHCISKHQSQGSKSESLPSQQHLPTHYSKQVLSMQRWLNWDRTGPMKTHRLELKWDQMRPTSPCNTDLPLP